MLSWLTAGESHGEQLTGIVDGIPAHLPLDEEDINYELRRRQFGYGRGDRMSIEKDEIRITGGVRYGLTTGAPISLVLYNRDYEQWKDKVSITPTEHPSAPLTAPRPGHSDFAGAVKYNQNDLRNVIERASARETAMRTALGAIAKKLLSVFGIQIGSHVLQIGSIQTSHSFSPLEVIQACKIDPTPLRCLDREAEQKMMQAIDEAKSQGDTLGGIIEVVAINVPIGLGSFVQWYRRLDGRIAQAILSIHAIKAVGFGSQVFSSSPLMGSQFHDEIHGKDDRHIYRATNSAGGIEGGMSNGEPIVVRLMMKPLASLGQPLATIDLETGEKRQALRERSDVCAVPAAGVVAEAMVALVLADALVEKVGGDSIEEMKAHFESWRSKWDTSI
ncbi:MAG: chorismate synthase [bacterium]|nr:chorismate synthase [bacterium]